MPAGTPRPAASDWAQDGHDATRGSFNPDEDRITAATVNELTRRWSVSTTPGGENACSRQSAPVVVGSRLFLTDATGVGAYNATTGRELWAYRPTSPADNVTPQLAADREVLIMYVSPCRQPGIAADQPGPLNPPQPSGEVIAVDAASGAVCWRHPAPATGSLIVDRGVTVVGGFGAAEMGVRAYASATGEPLWQRLGVIAHQPVADGRIMLGRPYHGGTLAVDITTGRPVWETERNWLAYAADPTGRYFIAWESDNSDSTASAPGRNPSMRLLKIRADSGRVAWQHEGLVGPLAVDRHRIYATAASMQTVVALDLNTGNTVWHRRLGQFEPSVAGGILWGNFGTPAGTRKIRALAPDTGADLPLSPAARGAAGFGRPVIAHGWLYLTNGDTLQAFIASDDADSTTPAPEPMPR